MRGASLGDDAEDEPVMAIRVGISLPGVGIG